MESWSRREGRESLQLASRSEGVIMGHNVSVEVQSHTKGSEDAVESCLLVGLFPFLISGAAVSV